MSGPPLKRMLTVRAASREYGFSEWQLRDAIGGEQLAAVRMPNGRIYIDRRDLEETIQRWKERARADATRKLRKPHQWAERAPRDDRGRFQKDSDRGDSAGTQHVAKPH